MSPELNATGPSLYPGAGSEVVEFVNIYCVRVFLCFKSCVCLLF